MRDKISLSFYNATKSHNQDELLHQAIIFVFTGRIELFSHRKFVINEPVSDHYQGTLYSFILILNIKKLILKKCGKKFLNAVHVIKRGKKLLKFIKCEKFISKSLIANNLSNIFLNMNVLSYLEVFYDYSEFKNTTFGNNVLNLKSLFLVIEWKCVTCL